MKEFTMWELDRAKKCAADGDQALHIHTLNSGKARIFRKYPVIAHLIDLDKDRLIATVRRLGVRVIKVEREGEPLQHIDLCGKPLERARAMCASAIVSDAK